MTVALALQLIYIVLGMFFISAAIRLCGSWARTGGKYKLLLAFVLTCIAIDAICELAQTVAVQPNRWLIWIVLSFGLLLVGLALRRTLQSLRTSPSNDPMIAPPPASDSTLPDENQPHS